MTLLLLSLTLLRTAWTAPDVVANVRKAISVHGVDKPWDETVLTGVTTFNGVEGKYTLQFQPEGPFFQSIQGPLGQTFGSDGQNFWQIDRMGASRRLAFEDVDRTKALILLLTDRWLDPEAHVNATLDRRALNDGIYRIHFKPNDTLLDEFVTIDPHTWLPSSAEFEIESSKTHIELSDWRASGSVRLPWTAKVTNEGLTDEFRVKEAVPGSRSKPEIYAFAERTPNDSSYDSSQPAAIETQRAASGHVLVHPKVNGKDIGWFILDSGAESMIIDPKAADALRLPKVGKESVMGVGGAVQEPFRKSDLFTLGPASIRNVTFVEVDLHELSDIFKVKLSGIVGYDFFRRFIVSLDLSKPQVEILNSTDFRLTSGVWTKLLFSTGNPALQASFEGDHMGWFRLDTGANGSVTLHAPLVEKLHLLDGRQTSAASMAGVGGATEARVGKLAWFDLGGKRFENLDVTFSLAKTGAFADQYLAGNIGQDLMEPFTVIFDFGGSRVAFLPH